MARARSYLRRAPDSRTRRAANQLVHPRCDKASSLDLSLHSVTPLGGGREEGGRKILPGKAIRSCTYVHPPPIRRACRNHLRKRLRRASASALFLSYKMNKDRLYVSRVQFYYERDCAFPGALSLLRKFIKDPRGIAY